MSDPDRIVVPTAIMYDAQLNPPPNGTRVHALNLGGVMVQTIWNSESHKYFDAWHPYLKVPDSVKQRRMKRHQHQESACPSLAPKN